MPNWCTTSYTFVGEKKELKKLHSIMSMLERRKKPLVKNGFGTTWLGCLVKALGEDWEKVWCRGDWSDLTLDEDTLKFTTTTAWSKADEVTDLIQKKFPSLSCFYYSEEPGMCIYETNDDCGDYYPERYCIDLCTIDEEYRTEYFQTMEAAIKWIGEMTEQTFSTREEIEEYFEVSRKENENGYCYFNEIEIANY